MDLRFTGLPGSVSTFKQQDEFLCSSFQRSEDAAYYTHLDGSLALDSMGDPLAAPVSNHEADPVFKYLNQILLEDDIDDKPPMSYDPTALEAAEKYFYEALDEKNHPSPLHSLGSHKQQSSDRIYVNSSELYSSNGSTSSNHSDPPQRIVDHGQSMSPLVGCPPEPYFHSLLPTSETSNGSLYSNGSSTNLQVDSLCTMQFKRGTEEANKFILTSNQLAFDLDSLPPKMDERPDDTITELENNDMESSLTTSASRKKHHHQDDKKFEGERSSKQSAVYGEEELSEMFDKVLLCDPVECPMNVLSEVGNGRLHNVPNGGDIPLSSEAGKSNSHNGRKRRGKRLQGDETSERVDVRTLLISCAQSVGASDCTTAKKHLKELREHCSPTGDANQRLAYVFANCLEARLAGTGSQIHRSLASKTYTALETLKAYRAYMSACPFKTITIAYANEMIYMVSLEAKVLHLIDFGILYGFQWPALIQLLSTRPGGPPKLRITGIGLPQPRFQPGELIEETGRRLAKYCERFGVPFEYNAIAARNWEAIKIEDFKLSENSDETVAVNCMFWLKGLADETVRVDSPRDAGLRLILKLKPSIFVHAIENGSFNSPFFVTRFREALFHYSAYFDIFDSTLPRDTLQRFLLEQNFYGRESLNVIACEGEERVVRPETYRQWHGRSMRAGFKPLPLNSEFMNKFRKTVEAGYHPEFVFGGDGVWMLQGWKGKVLCASSSWVPA
ncbi:unnamed protein product [Cuscuta campestris]|uniref:Uncharacterized protein n=1 Tax=Cuscuta campestris TaxID=132261 RepID=A0A484NGF0_9ASTE|nr:unnamed protein product [Cuscuta campestris]